MRVPRLGGPFRGSLPDCLRWMELVRGTFFGPGQVHSSVRSFAIGNWGELMRL